MTGRSEKTPFNPYASPRVSPVNVPEDATSEVSLIAYTTVRTGLKMMYYSIGTLAGIAVLLVFSSLVLDYGGDPVNSGFSSILLASVLMSVITTLVLIVGSFMTMVSPSPDEKFYAIISVLCFCLSIGTAFVGSGLIWSIEGIIGPLFILGSNIPSNASAIAFCLLLKRIGRNIASSRMQKSARLMLVWYGIFFVVCTVGGYALMIIVFQPAPTGQPRFSYNSGFFMVVSSYAIGIVALITLFVYLAMLRDGIKELKPRRTSEP